MRRLLLILITFASFAVQAQEGGFEWINEDQGIGRIGTLGNFKQVGTLLTDYAATTSMTLNVPYPGGGGATDFIITSRDGALYLTSYEEFGSSFSRTDCIDGAYRYINGSGRYGLWTGRNIGGSEGDVSSLTGATEQELYENLGNWLASCGYSQIPIPSHFAELFDHNAIRSLGALVLVDINTLRIGNDIVLRYRPETNDYEENWDGQISTFRTQRSYIDAVSG